MNSQKNGLEVAIIGISGRFPGSQSVDDFWENLKNGKNLTSCLPDLAGRKNKLDKKPKIGAILDDIEQFDANFFGFNPREAEVIDPQHRLFLECAWEALENAGYDSENEAKPIGVYAAVGMSTYLLHNLQSNHELMESRGFLQTLIGVDKDYAPTRVSYKLNLKGPSISVGTACSSSLVAVHLACQSLLSGECDMALAAGVSVKVPQNELTLSPEEIVSPDGECRAFDAKANGTLGGNGVGVVVCKRLEDAIADRDYIYAVIKGSAINNDGALKAGYTAPSAEGQARVIRAAQVMAEVEPETIAYMETHGTGTSLGDPIEIAAMTQAFRVGTEKKGYCAIGSVKTNVGHLDAAAGIVGLIKTVLSLHNQVLPPSLHFQTPNPQIDFKNSPFYVNTELREWKTTGAPRRAGVSSFGFGGTNAHLILEEAPAVGEQGSRGGALVRTGAQGRKFKLLVISAKTASALETATSNLANHLKQHPELNLADVAYTLQVGRRAFEQRRVVVAKDVEDAVNALESVNFQGAFSYCTQASDRPVTFMFTGQGAQYVNMARELYQTEATFREESDRCFQYLEPHLGLDLRQLLYPSQADAQNAAQQLQQTAIAQPALFVIEYALAKLWMSWGVRPQAMIGHSIGEYVAATVAGVFSLKDALALVATRGQLMQQQPKGAMLSVSLSAEQVQPLLGKNLSFAAANAPFSSVVSGSIEAVEQLESLLAEKKVNCRRLHTSHGFHSQMMNAIVEPFTQAVKKISLKPPQIPLISNLTGTWITTKDATDPNYWGRHLRQCVQFSQGISELLHDSQTIFLEIGPGQTLSTLTKQQAPERVVLSSLPHPRDKNSDVAFLLNSLGKLWLAGVRVDWLGFHAQQPSAAATHDRVPLPTYPFERQRYWIDPPEQFVQKNQVILEKKPNIADWFYIPSWKRSVASPRNLSTMLGQKKCILVFVDECGVGSRLVERLNQEGEEAIAVKVGSEFSQLSNQHPHAYNLNPKQSHDYKLLIEQLLAQNKLPNTIVHLWSVTPIKSQQVSFASHLEFELVENAQDLGFYSLLFLAQALGKQNLTNQFQINVVSNNLQEVTGEEHLCPEKATLLGTVKVIPQEYPNINCRSLDVDIYESINWQKNKVIDQLLTELKIPSSEQVIAYRGNHRWVQTFEPICLDDTAQERSRLREKGIYLITGGLGEIGFILAEYLAKTVQAKLILTGRSILPEKDEWSHWLATYDELNSTSQKIRKLQKLEELGAEVLVISADIASVSEMTNALNLAEKKFGQLNGVIHAAGILGEKLFCTIEQIGRIECEEQFKPKVQGLIVLEKILHKKELDFCILASSLSSILGGLGTVAYSAANLFMDAFIHRHNRDNSSLWSSINWDIWQAQKAQNQKQQASLGSKLAKFAITPTEGIEAFQRILFCDQLSQIVVSTGNLQARINQSLNLNTLPSKEDTQNVDSSLHTRPDLENIYAAPKTEIEQKIVSIWQELLGIKKIGIHDNFFELKGDSLLATRFISKVSAVFQIEVPINTLFESPTVADISKYIEIRSIVQKLPLPTHAAHISREEGEI